MPRRETRMSPVKAVVFDVGRVLVEWDMRLLFAQLVDDPVRLDWVLSEVITEDWHSGHDAGRDLDEMLDERKREYPDCADLLNAYATRFLETIPGHVPGSHELVRRLAGRRVPLFAITNFASRFWAEFRPCEPIFDLFGDIVVSGDEKIAKPDPAIFRLAATRFGYDPSEMLFIDDNAANIAAAGRMGWQVHHFIDSSSLETDLSRRGLI